MATTQNNIQAIKKNILVFNQILDEIPQLRYVGDPILRNHTVKVELGEAKRIGDKLGETLLQYRMIAGNGRGLAAPQIGIGKCVFVTYVDGELKTFINPTIIDKSAETNFYKELCLSSGVMAADVERPEWVVMKWIDEAGGVCEKRVEGFLARLYQHEEAHLRGLVNLDEAIKGGIEFVTFDPLTERLRKRK